MIDEDDILEKLATIEKNLATIFVEMNTIINNIERDVARLEELIGQGKNND